MARTKHIVSPNFEVINDNIKRIIHYYEQQDTYHVPIYDWLMTNLDQLATPHFQYCYINFWGMNMPQKQFTPQFLKAYFSKLQASLQNPDKSPESVTGELYHEVKPTTLDGKNSNEFSFVTKLCHMSKPNSPIFDSKVASFYGYQNPSYDEKLKIYDSLCIDYPKEIKSGKLSDSIQKFQDRLKPQQFTDEKIIDSLIWAYEKTKNDRP